MMNKKKNLKLEIIELFMAKAGKKGWDRCFHGTIKREIDSDGNPYVFGKINVLYGFVCAQATDEKELGKRLDELVLMVLDYSLNCHPAMTTIIYETNFNLN